MADALSWRVHGSESELVALSVYRPVWLEAILNSYHEDAAAQQRIAKLALAPDSEEGFSLQEGVVRFQGRIWIGQNEEIQQSLIKALHDSAAGGHSGFHATYSRVRRLFAWKGLKEMVLKFVRECQVCQQAKTERVSLAGLLQPLPIPKKAVGSCLIGFH